MGFLKALTRTAGLGLCAVAFTGSALADPGNGNGSGNGGTPPGQEKKAEQAAPAPAPAAAPAPAPQQSAPGQAKKAEKSAAKTNGKPADKTGAKAESKAAAKSEQKAAQSKGRSAEAHHHVVICHRTGSDSNPYVVINIPWTAWSEAHSPDTGAHPDLNGRHDIMLKDPASRPGSKDGFDKGDCEAAAGSPAVQTETQTDVCPNLDGMQTEVPAGMVKDESGNCVHKPVQAQVDVCPNLAGMQTEVPAGMVKDESGNCVHKPVQAQVDVCPNLAGMQSEVPAGMVKDANGHCVAAPASAVTPGGKSDKGGKGAKGAKAAPAGEVLGASAPAATDDEPASGVLGAVASAPDSIAQTATSGSLPFTGIPLWIAALLGGGLLATGLALRRAAQH